MKKSADTGIVISKAPHRRYFIFIHKVIHTKMRSVWIWWWCLYWSSLCLKTPVSSLLNLALKAMKLETLCAKTKPDKSFTTSRCALVRIRLRVGLKFCTHKKIFQGSMNRFEKAIASPWMSICVHQILGANQSHGWEAWSLQWSSIGEFHGRPLKGDTPDDRWGKHDDVGKDSWILVEMKISCLDWSEEEQNLSLEIVSYLFGKMH